MLILIPAQYYPYVMFLVYIPMYRRTYSPSLIYFLYSTKVINNY